MAQRKYHCSQAELYTTSLLGWAAFKRAVPTFSNFRPMYNIAYADAAIIEIEAAEKLPAEQARYEAAEILRIKLAQKGKEVTNKFQFLKRYIEWAYPKDYHATMLDSAGYNHYAKAANQNWDSVRALLTAATEFIAQHQAALTLNENMPPSFAATLTTLRTEFNDLHQQFLAAEEIALVATQHKIAANNAVYDKLIAMLSVGQELFKYDEAIRKQFVFSELLYLASGAGTSGIKGHIIDAVTKKPIANATIFIVEKDRELITDEKGKYEGLQIASGKYTLRIKAEGYADKLIEQHEVKLGTASTLNIEL